MDKKELSQNECVIKETWPTCSKCNTNQVERDSRRGIPYPNGLCVSCRKQQKRLDVKHEIETELVRENRAFPKELIENHPWLKNTIRDIIHNYKEYLTEMPEAETEYILRELHKGFETSLFVARKDEIKSLGGTKFKDSFYDETDPYGVVRKMLMDMQKLIQGICRQYQWFCNHYDMYMRWLSEDKDDNFAMKKRLMLNEMVRTIPVEIQDQAIEALRGVIETNTITQAAQETATA